MTTKETATEIRKAIKKQLGLSSRQVSVRGEIAGYSSVISITVKSLDIALEPIEKITESYDSYTYDEVTQEILAGGNMYVNVKYDWKLKYPA